MSTSLGNKLRKLRKEKGLTLEELAKATESSRSYIWELENKEVSRPSAVKLARIATELGVTPEFLLDTDQASPTDSVFDDAFFRKFQSLDQQTKEKLKRILDVLDNEDE